MTTKYYRKMNNPPSQKKLHELLHYNPETGVFTWKITRNAKARKGSRAGHKKFSWWSIGVDGASRMASEVAWCYVLGSWPETFKVNHINGDRCDTRWENLEEGEERILHKPKRTKHTPKEGRKSINSMKVGTWEDKYFKCPPASKKSPRQFFKEMNEEMAGIPSLGGD